MGIFNWFTNLFSLANTSSITEDHNFLGSNVWDNSETNPANGMPMIGGIDILGNAYGTDSSHDFLSSSCSDDFLSSSCSDDFLSSSCSDDFCSISSTSFFDDTWSSSSDDIFSDW